MSYKSYKSYRSYPPSMQSAACLRVGGDTRLRRGVICKRPFAVTVNRATHDFRPHTPMVIILLRRRLLPVSFCKRASDRTGVGDANTCRRQWLRGELDRRFYSASAVNAGAFTPLTAVFVRRCNTRFSNPTEPPDCPPWFCRRVHCTSRPPLPKYCSCDRCACEVRAYCSSP